MHDIKESFRVKKPTILLNYIAIEASKNYFPAQIFYTICGSRTVEGSEWLTAIGGSSLTRQDIGNIKRSMKTADK